MEEARRRLALPKSPVQAANDLAAQFVKQSTGQLAGQIPAAGGAGIPLNPDAPADQPAKPRPDFLFADEFDPAEQKFAQFQKRPGESDETFAVRIEASAPRRAPKKPAVEIADEAVRVAGRIGKVEEYTGPRDQAENISKHKCPFCRDVMFVSQDQDGNGRSRCPRHGYMSI